MGNCCGGGEEAVAQPSRNAFQGEGQRLGSANEDISPLSKHQAGGKHDDKVPEPRYDPNVTDGEREQQRKERIAAAEARLKKAGGKPKKKKEYKDVPLTGPNSKPVMTWTAG